MSEGTRTPDRLDHNQELYQLSYAHRGGPESSIGSPSWASGVRIIAAPDISRLGAASTMPVDLVIDIENTPGALADVAAAISDAGVNIAAATCVGPGERAELHILVPHGEAAKHLLAISHLAVSRERQVVVIEVEDRPGVLADLTCRVARAGVNLDLVYVATRNRVVFGSPDLPALKAALESSA